MSQGVRDGGVGIRSLKIKIIQYMIKNKRKRVTVCSSVQIVPFFPRYLSRFRLYFC